MRWRLALWNSLVLAAALAASGALIWTVVTRALQAQLDTALGSKAADVAAATAGNPAFPSLVFLPDVGNFTSADTFLQVVRPDGRLVDRSPNLGREMLPIDPQTLDAAAHGASSFGDRTVAGERLRVFTTPLQLRGITVAVLQVARSTGSLDETRRLLALALLGTGGAGLAVSLGLGWWLAGLTLSPVRRVTQTAREIALSGEPDRRLDYHGPHDELGVLAATFNTMLDRLSTVLAAQRRFVADASHELRTPMTTLRLNLHSLLRQPYDDDPDERREVLRDMADEIDRLSRLVAGLLELARADAGRRPPSEPVALDEVAREVAHTLAPLAAGRLGLDRLDPVDVTGSRDGLRQVLLILVDNALKFSPPDRPVSLRIQLDRALGRVLIEVEDRGPGIAAEDLPHLFERFYRSAVARQTSGTGLGLAIARTIVEEHGGTIVVESALGRGSTFRVSLPLARERAGAVRPRVERPAPSVGAAR